MKNYTQKGDTLTLAAPYDRSSGQGAKIGSIFGVAASDVLNGEDGEFDVVGCFDLDKTASQAWTQGVKVYWDDTNKVCTSTASGNTLIGVATAAVAGGAGDVIGNVRLNGSF